MYKKLLARRQELTEKEGGFTLIELLVVVVIIGILVAIAIPLYLHFENGAKESTAQSDVRSAIPAVEQALQDANTGSYPAGTPASCANTAATACKQIVVFANAGSNSATDAGDVINVSPGNTDTYSTDGTNYVVTASASDGTKWYYANFGTDSGHVTKVASNGTAPGLPGAVTPPAGG